MPASTRSHRENNPQTHAAPEELTISDWPLGDRPLGSALALTLAAGAAWLAFWATGNAVAGAIVAILLGLTLWRAWLPVRYQLGPSGVTQSALGRKRRIPWTAIRSFDLRSDGVILLPDAGAGSFGAVRGLYLHWGRHRDEVLAQLDHYLTPRARPRSGSSLGSTGQRGSQSPSGHS